MSPPSLIVGCGYLGCAVAKVLGDLGHEVHAFGREPARTCFGASWIFGDLLRPETIKLPEVEHIYFTAAPDESTEAAYRALFIDGLGNLLARLPGSVSRIIFTSSTSVYGQSNGEWVDESSPTEPTNFRGRILLEAENLLRSASTAAITIRLGGLYGPGRTSLVERIRSGEAVLPSLPLYSNRIHRDDAARLFVHLAALPDPAPTYLGVDDAPADLHDVMTWIARRLNRPLSPSTAPPRTFGKRGRNTFIRSTGFTFLYPTWQEGYVLTKNLEMIQ